MQFNCQNSLLYIIRIILVCGGVVYILWHPLMYKRKISRCIWILYILMASIYYLIKKIFDTLPLMAKSAIFHPDTLTVVTLITILNLILINACVTIELLDYSHSTKLLFHHFYSVVWHNKRRLPTSHALILICFLSIPIVIVIVDIFLDGTVYYSFIRALVMLLWLFMVIWEALLCLRQLNNDLQGARDLSTLKQIRGDHNYVCSLVGAINQNYGFIIIISVFSSITGGCQTILISPIDVPFKEKILLYVHYLWFTVSIQMFVQFL